jgi:hypothetical protein
MRDQTDLSRCHLCPFCPKIAKQSVVPWKRPPGLFYYIGKYRHTPDSSGKPAGCAAPEDLERIAGLGPKKLSF